MEEESNDRRTTFVQAESLTQDPGEEVAESQNPAPPEEGSPADRGAGDGEAGQDLCVSGAESLPQETLTETNTPGDDEGLPLSPLPTEEQMTSPLVLSHPANTPNRPPEPCWYCLRSLDSEFSPETTKAVVDSDAAPSPPSSGQKVSYQTDPRPHFGVACSSRSTCRPLWGSEGPYWRQRNQEAPDQTDTCPHCHLGLPPDTLRWHEAKCLLFEGLRSTKK